MLDHYTSWAATPLEASTVDERTRVLKTYKLFVDGKFPRSESGRTLEVMGDDGVVHLCRGSRKDFRDAVTAARKAQPGWAGATAFLRGQILYRAAEMLEGRRAEFAEAIKAGESGWRGKKTKKGGGKKVADVGGDAEVSRAVDRLVHYAGWCDKVMQVLGNANPVAGPYYNFTVPQATGVVVVMPPDRPALLGLVSLLAPALCAGNAVIVVASGEGRGGWAGVVASIFGEVCQTSDLPPGVVNILTGLREELVPVIALHRDVDGVVAWQGEGGCTSTQAAELRAGAAENLKRVRILTTADFFDDEECEGPQWIEPLVEMKTMWHPSAT
jgi:acyl-CoA reductase-like NAD-dependent aldehyde dehydrogenase